jgi:hypothetical protein
MKGKVRVNLSSCLTPQKRILLLIQRHAIKTYGGVEVMLHAFLTLPLDGDDYSVLRPSRFTLQEIAPGTHCIGG